MILLGVAGWYTWAATWPRPVLLVDELCPKQAPTREDETAWRKAWLAGRCLIEIGPARAGRRDMGQELVKRCPCA